MNNEPGFDHCSLTVISGLAGINSFQSSYLVHLFADVVCAFKQFVYRFKCNGFFNDDIGAVDDVLGDVSGYVTRNNGDNGMGL
jgi:hypothetical protein